MIGRMLLAEILIILLVSGMLCAIALWTTDANAEGLVRRLFLG